MPDRVELDNADDNVCFCCGPDNPMGLQLTFYREGDVVTTEADPDRWWSGQPGVVNPGLKLAILADLVQWTHSEFRGTVPLIVGRRRFELGDVSVRAQLSGRGRIVEEEGRDAVVRAEILQDGEVRSVFEVEARTPTSKEYERAHPLVDVPESLDGFFAEG